MAMVESALRPLKVPLDSEAETRALAARLATLIQAGDVIALSGDLGAGKTTFARALINALPRPGARKGEPAEDVPSPTFTLVQIYDRQPAPVWHFDLYRLERPEEVYELGFEEALAEGITVIEWPERLGPLLPASRLDLQLDFAAGPDERRARLVASGSWQPRLSELAPPLSAQRKA